jgi:hypothetical protein
VGRYYISILHVCVKADTLRLAAFSDSIMPQALIIFESQLLNKATVHILELWPDSELYISYDGAKDLLQSKLFVAPICIACFKRVLTPRD